MEHGSIACVPEPQERHRWVFAYRLEGDLRYISHHDTLRLFRRALVRAQVPLRYTEGFNPHPRIMIPLPRSVGIASEMESVVIETVCPIVPDYTLRCLQRNLPEDIRLLSVRELEAGERLQPDLVRYRIELGDDWPVDLDDRIRGLLETDTAEVERLNRKTGITRRVNVRSYLVALRREADTIEFTLRVTGAGTAKPAEIAGLLGYDPGAINHRIRRLEIQWQ